jgi:hypothetical protein
VSILLPTWLLRLNNFSQKIMGILGTRFLRQINSLKRQINSYIVLMMFECTNPHQTLYKVSITNKAYRAFAHDVTAAMLVFQFKRILIRLFCRLEHQHGRHDFCWVVPWGMKADFQSSHEAPRRSLRVHAWALSSNHNAKQLILIRCKHSQRAARTGKPP